MYACMYVHTYVGTYVCIDVWTVQVSHNLNAPRVCTCVQDLRVTRLFIWNTCEYTHTERYSCLGVNAFISSYTCNSIFYSCACVWLEPLTWTDHFSGVWSICTSNKSLHLQDYLSKPLSNCVACHDVQEVGQ